MSCRRGAMLGPQKSRSSSRTCLLLPWPMRWKRSANTKRVSSGVVPSLCGNDGDDGMAPGGQQKARRRYIFQRPEEALDYCCYSALLLGEMENNGPWEELCNTQIYCTHHFIICQLDGCLHPTMSKASDRAKKD